ncbi:MAG: response regulator [Solirubrobacterales bacterium]|nr:response regulator [Solirubrobacterales bacterium]
MTPAVLIVDDDRFIRKLITTTLEDVSGFSLLEAEDGRAAIEAALEFRPRLVFLDVDMPRLDGISTLRELRAMDSLSDTTIVMLTAGHEHEADAREAGADEFLTKPFSPLDLLRLVEDLAQSL